MSRNVPSTLGIGILALILSGMRAFSQQSSANATEQKAARAFEAARKSPLALHALIEKMPKGADLHMHLSGAIYAETFIKDAAADLLCVNVAKLKFEKNIGSSKSLPPQAVCGDGAVPAASALKDQSLYDGLVDAFSMRSFVPVSGRNGHDQFFDSFGRFGGVEKVHRGEWLDEVATRAAAQNEQYLEIMETPTFSAAVKLGNQLGWPARPASAHVPAADDIAGTTPAELSKLRDQLLAAGLRDEVETDRRDYANALADRGQIEHCGTERCCTCLLRSNSLSIPDPPCKLAATGLRPDAARF